MTLFTKPIAYALSSEDTAVIIAVDVTDQSACTDVLTVNKGTQQEVTKRFPCRPGSIIMSKKVSLSQAQQQQKD